MDEIPALDAFLGAIPAAADCLFLHDVAILRRARGSRSAAKPVELLEGIALTSGLRRLALIFVYATKGLWGRRGFQQRALSAASHKLSSYGEGAYYMIRPL